MKFAVLSDIHSNVFALEAVIADAKKHSVDLMVNLGDILYGPIAPKATYELLMQYEIVTICGNQDRQIFEATAAELASNPTMKFIIDDLGDEPITWMKSLPFDAQLNADVYLCHGTPDDDLTYLLENVELGYARLRSDSEIIKLLNGQNSTLICCGHTHTPRTVSLTTGQTIINPGSVGLQAYTDDEPIVHSMENFSSMASYSIVEKTEDNWNIKHIRVPYDVKLAVAECEKRNRMDWVHFLTTGRRI
ncbi:metallophosphoesterase family protein [Colwellia psychrerythraea]|uniref:Ser/Thr protein phosphatase family protein n=1 Tax=Colwellia psychrerythraea (strain 34H / ATCC BAA-681) TaxID=167879 RepID=Q47ZF8_COLP3|nr:metallophosphoesterase family protein [Colwellia psychrerythraea]AAZ24587.1 Ser/Thr protein phosphatase family protein [Colwellia psychrerythraea 34H]